MLSDYYVERLGKRRMQVIDYDQWKSDIVQHIDAATSTTEKGDRFVQMILRNRYQLSEDDAVNATDSAGAGDRGIDAVYVTPADADQPPSALVLQGKYGTAGEGFSPYQEFAKFATGLQDALDGHAPTDALHQCASVLKSDGIIQYTFATVTPLSASAQTEVNDVRTLARKRFEEHVLVEAISLKDVYQEVVGAPGTASHVEIRCQGVEAMPTVYVGTASLAETYRMLRQYAKSHNGVLDSIYDRNVRKWLGKRAKSVNAGIVTTLQKAPDRFIAYNNGITIVCRGFTQTAQGLQLDSPQIVNGCQTTRTLYDFMENEFAGLADQLEQHGQAGRYFEALLPFKLIAVSDLDSDLVKDITRYSNKQNAVRGRDFLTLEDDFQRLKHELAARGYFLEVQTGEYNVLPKSEREHFPASRVINAFDGLRFYGAAVLGKPHTAFGRSGDFTAGGREFDTVMDGLTSDDLFVPWLVARDAEALGYSVGAKHHTTSDDHRNQTRYFFAYIFFRVLSHVLRDTPEMDLATRNNLYGKLIILHDASEKSGASDTPYNRLLKLADGAVATYMYLAKKGNWYTDRNAFLKSIDLLNEEHLNATSGPMLLEMTSLRQEAESVLKQ